MIYSLKFNSDERNASLLDDIRQSLSMIIFTSKNERIYLPDYGADALAYLDKPPWELVKLQVAIVEQTAKYEKRVTVKEVVIISADPQKGIVRLGLQCVINVSGLREYFEISNA